MSGLFISASGVLNAIQRMDITANNIANLRTPGFRASRPISSPAPGGGVSLGEVSRAGGPGPLESTGQPLDLAAGGDAFFRVRLADGSFAFTRNGHFGLNAQGQVVASGGGRLDPPIQTPPGASSISVTPDGTVFATVPGEDGPQALGQLQVFVFPNMEGLEAIGGNLFRASAASGAAQLGGARTPIVSGFVEGSNVDLATEQINLLLNRHAFQANLNAFRAQAEVLGELWSLEE